jgi:hypothetical protein
MSFAKKIDSCDWITASSHRPFSSIERAVVADGVGVAELNTAAGRGIQPTCPFIISPIEHLAIIDAAVVSATHSVWEK